MYDFRDKARYWWKIEMFSYPLHSTPPLGGPRLNIAIPFGTDKLEQRGYPMVQKYDDININNLPHRAIFHSTGWSVHISVKTYDDWCTTRFRSDSYNSLQSIRGPRTEPCGALYKKCQSNRPFDC